MIDFTNESRENILNEMLKRVPNDIDKREGSIIGTALSPIAYIIFQAKLELSLIQDNSFVGTANGLALDYIAAERGVSRKQPVQATRKGIFNIKVDIGSRFSTLNGNDSVIFKVIQYLGEEEGNETFELQCEEAGTIGNNYAGNIQSLNPIANLTYAILADIIINGTPEEDDDSLRQRYIETLTEKPFAGNIASYKTEILAIDGVGALQIYPFWKGGGTVLCSIITTAFEPAATALIEKVQNIICPPEPPKETPSANGYGIAPIGALVTIGTAIKKLVTIKATITIGGSGNPENIKEAGKIEIEKYFLEVRKKWGDMEINGGIIYKVQVLHAKIVAILVGIEGMYNVKNVLLNDLEEDINCEETSLNQELPFLDDIIFTIE